MMFALETRHTKLSLCGSLNINDSYSSFYISDRKSMLISGQLYVLFCVASVTVNAIESTRTLGA